MQYFKYDDACYFSGMTFLFQIWKAHWLSLLKFWKLTHFPNLYLESPHTWPSKIMLLGKRYPFPCMSLMCAFIYQYLVQVRTNTIQFPFFLCRYRWTLNPIGWRCNYPDVELSFVFCRSSCFQECLPLLCSLNVGFI